MYSIIGDLSTEEIRFGGNADYIGKCDFMVRSVRNSETCSTAVMAALAEPAPRPLMTREVLRFCCSCSSLHPRLLEHKVR